MELKDNELRSLMALLQPKFESVEQRKRILFEAFGKEDAEALGNIVNADNRNTEEFTTTLLNTLHNSNIRLGTGKLALTQILQSMQATERTTDTAFPDAVQPFIDLLELPTRTETAAEKAAKAAEKAAEKAQTVIAATPTIASKAMSQADVTHEHGRRRRKRSLPSRVLRRAAKVFRWQVIAVIILIIVTVPPVSALALVTDANARVQQSISDVRRIMGSMTNRSFTELNLNDFQRLQLSVDELSDNLVRAQQQTALIRRFSGVRADLSTILTTLDAASDVSLAAKDMLTGLQPTLFFLVGNKEGSNTGTGVATAATLSSGERMVELLTSGQGLFQSANQHLADAKIKIEQMQQNLQNVSPSLLLNTQELIRYYERLQSINSILLDSPNLLTHAFGLDAAQNYLILSQNSDELRPSGGFISTYGYMRVRGVKIVDYSYGPSTEISPNPPPADLASQLNIPPWWLQTKSPIHQAWDGSWYADYSQTAKWAAWYYDNGNNPRSPVDGVIGIDLYGFEYILKALGSVTVPGYNEVVTSENFREVIYKIRESTNGREVEHKKFLSEMYRQILLDWQTNSQSNGDKLFTQIVKALQEKHIMMYFKDPKINQAIDLLGWSGKQPSATDHDYLMVVDANDLGSKSNRSILRAITYDVKIQPDGSTQSRIAVGYEFPASVAEKDPGVNPRNYHVIDYGNLLQVFVPASSISTGNVSFTRPLTTVPNPDYTIFLSDTRVKYNDSARFQISYNTPVIVQSFGPYHQYRLFVQKQPGTDGDPVEVQVTLPTGAKIVSSSPTPAIVHPFDAPVAVFQFRLSTDQWIDIIYSK